MIFNKPAFTDFMYLSTHSSKLNFPNNFFSWRWNKLSNAKYGFTVVAPTPINVAKECVSKASPDCTFIDTYPLSFFSIRNELIFLDIDEFRHFYDIYIYRLSAIWFQNFQMPLYVFL